MANERGKPLGRLTPLPALVLLLIACGPMNQSQWIAKYDGDIADATKAIDAARDDGARARAHSARGRGYSEKARYSRVVRKIAADEYGRLFDLAIQDHGRAIELAPGDAQVYLDRGLTYYDRAILEDRSDPKTKALLDSAEADFTRAIERDGRNARAFDMRGLVNLASEDYDQAVTDFSEEMAIDSRLGELRLAVAYCDRGSARQKAGNYDSSISDYEKAIEFGMPADGCDCQPESPLAWLYFQKKDYDRSWEVVRKARGTGRWIAPELIEDLKKASGKNG